MVCMVHMSALCVWYTCGVCVCGVYFTVCMSMCVACVACGGFMCGVYVSVLWGRCVAYGSGPKKQRAGLS